MSKILEFKKAILNGCYVEFSYKKVHYEICILYDKENDFKPNGFIFYKSNSDEILFTFKNIEDLIENFKYDGLTLKELLENVDSIAYT